MKGYFASILLILLFLASFHGYGQELPPSFEDIIEPIIGNLDEDDPDFSSILENLENFYENPLNVNSATKNDLQNLCLMSDFQISQLLNYREKNGNILSIFELNTVEGFNREILERIQPFISFLPGEKREDNIQVKYAKQQFLLRATRVLQKQKGFKTGKDSVPVYEGSPEKLYARYKFKVDDRITAGFTAEKDPGESFFKGSNHRGFDFYSAYASMTFNSFLKNVVVGDFLAQSGQGLVLWQGFGTGKSTDVMNIQKFDKDFSPYTSSDENRFFRGLAANFEYKNMGLSVFVSSKNKDANLEDSENGSRFFTSLQTSGYHRTKSEIADEKSVKETSSGAILSFRKNRLKLGSTFIFQQFNHPFIRENEPNNLFRFSGTKNFGFGVDYTCVLGKYQFFGESAVSKSGGKAILQGLIAHLHDRADFSFLFRHYDKNYQTLVGDAFSESSGNANETGFYTGVQLLPVQHFKVSAYADFYRFPWLTYSTVAPSGGADFLARIDYTPSEKIKMYLRIKDENKEAKSEEGPMKINSTLKTKNIRFHLEYNPSNIYRFRSRVEYSFYRKDKNENGFMAYQDFLFTPDKIPLAAQLRVAWVHTDSYNTRFYAFENDLLYSYSMPVYYGKSIRSYLNINFKLTDNIELWLKVSNTTFSDRTTVGTGYNEVAGKSLTEVKIQSRIRF
jgi:hypothetical protein